MVSVPAKWRTVSAGGSFSVEGYSALVYMRPNGTLHTAYSQASKYRLQSYICVTDGRLSISRHRECSWLKPVEWVCKHAIPVPKAHWVVRGIRIKIYSAQLNHKPSKAFLQQLICTFFHHLVFIGCMQTCFFVSTTSFSALTLTCNMQRTWALVVLLRPVTSMLRACCHAGPRLGVRIDASTNDDPAMVDGYCICTCPTTLVRRSL